MGNKSINFHTFSNNYNLSIFACFLMVATDIQTHKAHRAPQSGGKVEKKERKKNEQKNNPRVCF